MVDDLLFQEDLKKIYSLDISYFSKDFLNKTFSDRMLVAACSSVQDYLQYLLENHDEQVLLKDSLTITYTDFFRSSIVFAFLEQVILPQIIACKEMTVNPGIRVWSAGCSSGQEAYSIAIILAELLMKRQIKFNWKIFATDISEKELNRAAKGEYPAQLTENLKIKHLTNYFSKKGDIYLIDKLIREHILFSNHDLLDESSIAPPQSIFGDFDIIICSNVLLYFNPEVQKKIIDKFYKSMTGNGYLIVGDDETSVLKSSTRFVHAFSSSPIYYKR